MSKRLNILFLGGAKRVSFAEHLIAAGCKKEIDVCIFSYELNQTVPIASVGKVILGLRWKDVALDKHLISVIKEFHIGMVLPFVDPAVEVAARLKTALPDVFIPCSPIEICRIMFDKKCSEEWFISRKFPIPQSYRLQEIPVFPVILKPRKGSASKGIRIITDRVTWLSVENPDEYVIQKYIAEREEFTVDAYVSSSGKIISVVPRLRLDVAGGEVMNSVTVRDERLIALSREIILAGGFRGPVTIQFLRDKTTDEIYIMEINPRLGGGVIVSIEAGADIPLFLLEEEAGNMPEPVDDWRENTLMTRYFKEVIFYADHH
ncbi:ATP-grasp domain-containing protein [Coprobacter tertius]|uniref:ATP-grasp domain-containing protein n=1 Tax=Coprobacter tertius TaxID=2944915 RepID=A0ABT1MD81_9BACT|nr:ATP-grasp domain-containing protein [Coprobacter tertius]MCP9610597.1 ATP-grasp domain-containing protein [Coprobacter tertius]